MVLICKSPKCTAPSPNTNPGVGKRNGLLIAGFFSAIVQHHPRIRMVGFQMVHRHPTIRLGLVAVPGKGQEHCLDYILRACTDSDKIR
jgi:hypothetical protein